MPEPRSANVCVSFSCSTVASASPAIRCWNHCGSALRRPSCALAAAGFGYSFVELCEQSEICGTHLFNFERRRNRYPARDIVIGLEEKCCSSVAEDFGRYQEALLKCSRRARRRSDDHCESLMAPRKFGQSVARLDPFIPRLPVRGQ